MNDDTVIRLEGLWKRYGLRVRPASLLLTWPFRTASTSDAAGPWALRDVSLEVRQGETVGIIGRNGAGKSTLLKVLAGVTPSTRGQVAVRGRVFPMIELNAGLHPELTGRENVRLLGAIMGHSRREVEKEMPDIEAFCELGDWFDRPVRTYSSGMLARLGFSVAMSIRTDILLVDEILAVGDLAFQRKSFAELARIRKQGLVTTLFVSHNIRQVERLCDRVIVLEAGEIVLAGDPTPTINAYSERSMLSETAGFAHGTGQLRPTDLGTGEMVIAGIDLFDADGQKTDKVKVGHPVTLRLSYSAPKPIEKPIVAIGIWSSDLVPITTFTNEHLVEKPCYHGEGFIQCTISSLQLLPGVYSMHVKIVAPDSHTVFLSDHRLCVFQVVLPDLDTHWTGFQGFVYLDVHWTLESKAEQA